MAKYKPGEIIAFTDCFRVDKLAYIVKIEKKKKRKATWYTLFFLEIKSGRIRAERMTEGALNKIQEVVGGEELRLTFLVRYRLSLENIFLKGLAESGYEDQMNENIKKAERLVVQSKKHKKYYNEICKRLTNE